MGANAQTSVPVFTSGQVLTAQQQTEINTGIPVFATSVERDAAFGGTGEKTLAEGQFAYLEDTDITQYYDGASWETLGPATAGGLVLISTTTLSGATTDITFASATYSNYKILIRETTATGDCYIRLGTGGVFNSTAGNYRWNLQSAVYTSATITGDNSSTSRTAFPIGTSGFYNSIELYRPFEVANTGYTWVCAPNDYGYQAGGGTMTVTTAYDQIRILPDAGTLSGTCSIYGYAK